MKLLFSYFEILSQCKDIHKEKAAITVSMDTARILIQSLTWDAGSRMSKKHICMTCSGKVEGFDSELSRKEFLISGMCQKCQDSIFDASEEDSEEICMVTFG
jgi:hypothetical protein